MNRKSTNLKLTIELSKNGVKMVGKSDAKLLRDIFDRCDGEGSRPVIRTSLPEFYAFMVKKWEAGEIVCGRKNTISDLAAHLNRTYRIMQKKNPNEELKLTTLLTRLRSYLNE